MLCQTVHRQSSSDGNYDISHLHIAHQTYHKGNRQCRIRYRHESGNHHICRSCYHKRLQDGSYNILLRSYQTLLKTYLLFLNDLNIIKAVPIVINNGLRFLKVTAQLDDFVCIRNITIVIFCRGDIPHSKRFVHDILFHAFHSPLPKILTSKDSTLFIG
nr:MAG TPA: hypothetical protein [Caudoviricetes sp.]